MEDRLFAFLKKLATDPKELKAYRLDPDGTMKKADLSKAEVAAMKSKDPARIVRALGCEECPFHTGIMVIVV